MTDLIAMATHDPERLTWAGGSVVAFLFLCLWAAVKNPAKAMAASGASLDYLVLYASQTGQAEELARASHARLMAGGFAAGVASVREVTLEGLQRAKHTLWVISTTGDGDAPDEAMGFERGLMKGVIDLSGQTFAVLALGDRHYEHFCAFGHRVHEWLRVCGAQAVIPCLEVDDLKPEDLARWNAQLDRWGATKSDASGTDGLYTPWLLQSRQRLNPDSDAAALYQLELTPKAGVIADWQAGDLAEIITPGGHRRDYSIASLPREEQVRLFVRQVTLPDGGLGEGSGFLTSALEAGGDLRVRLKSHQGFHAPTGTGGILLIGAGSGLAGLRAHILQAEDEQRPTWLIYGERHPARDGALCEELKEWRDRGVLQALDLAFSDPDSGDGLYVQDVLAARAVEVFDFLSNSGAVLVCGGLNMGRAVEANLRSLMGEAWVDDAIANGAYRRDLY